MTNTGLNFCSSMLKCTLEAKCQSFDLRTVICWRFCWDICRISSVDYPGQYFDYGRAGPGDSLKKPESQAQHWQHRPRGQSLKQNDLYQKNHTQRHFLCADSYLTPQYWVCTQSRTWTPLRNAQPTTYMISLAGWADVKLWSLCNKSDKFGTGHMWGLSYLQQFWIM